MSLIVKGNLVQISSFGKLNVLKDAILGFLEGKIVLVEENEPGSDELDMRCREALQKQGIDPKTVNTIVLKVSIMLKSGALESRQCN